MRYRRPELQSGARCATKLDALRLSKLRLSVELAKPCRFACFAPDLQFHPAPGRTAERLDDRVIRQHAGRNGDFLHSLADQGDVDRFRDSPGE
jgi:hypothetical protein